MHAINIIGKHLDRGNLKLQIESDIEGVCIFTGQKINEGVLVSKLIKKTFTDQRFLRYKSKYASIDAALCIEAVYDTGTRLNSLRNYSYIATERELKILKREEVLDVLLNLKDENFVLAYTYSYSSKKHTSYKCVVNTSAKLFCVTTDRGNVRINMRDVKNILPVMQSWYTVIKGKEGTKAQPTNFTKGDILAGCDQHKKIHAYGIEKYFKENEILKPYRDTAFLQFLTSILNKKLCSK